jgi:competence protein ComEA
MPRVTLDALPRPSRGTALRLALGAAAVVAFALLVLRSGGDRGIEVERREPLPGIDEIRVEVGGAVARPGVVTVQPGARVVDAIALADGLDADADTAPLNLSRRLRDEDRVLVPRAGERSPLLDVNAASAAQLDALPGIGAAYSEAIVSAREREGPFATTDDLVARGVIPEHVYEGIRDLIAAR